MSSWVIVALVAIIASSITSYFENAKKTGNVRADLEKEIEGVNKKMQQIVKRIENLEAIAANDPDGFKRTEWDTSSIEFEQDEWRGDENTKEINRMANHLKNK